jgi:transcriptional regulator with PAS, ATPase and Fis domain
MDIIEIILAQSTGAIRRAIAHEEEIRELRTRIEKTSGFGDLIGKDPQMQIIYKLIEDVAPTDATVLIQGESGTGKELVADYIHAASKRGEGPLVKVNCGAIPESLMESELFGFEKGSFTGADRQRIGMLEQASKGTLFLDEVGEIPASMQVKLLRALQAQKIIRIGGQEDIPVDFRLVAATNRDVADLVEDGVLREDFYFRLNVIPVTIPPLRERTDDIPVLIEHFVAYHSASHDLPPIRFKPDAVELLVSHSWPGNVRELQNVIERLQVLHPGTDIEPRHLPKEIRKSKSSEGVHFEAVPTNLELRAALRQFEQRYIERIIEEENGNKAAAARRLGVARETLWKKLSD